MLDDYNTICCIIVWACSSVAEHGIADPAVAGSTPVAPSFLQSEFKLMRRYYDESNVYISNWVRGLVVTIPASGAGGRGFDSRRTPFLFNSVRDMFCFMYLTPLH